MRVRVEEEPLDHDVWGNLIDIEVRDEDEELKVLEIASKHVKRNHKLFRDGVETKKSIPKRIEELRKRGRK